MAQYTDAFTSDSANLNGRVTETGDEAWIVKSGVWSVTGGKPKTTTAVGSNPYAVIDIGTADADVSISTSASGDCIYFRATDSNNWWRLRFQRSSQTTYSPVDEWYYSYSHGPLHTSPAGAVYQNVAGAWQLKSNYDGTFYWTQNQTPGYVVGQDVQAVYHGHGTAANNLVYHTHNFTMNQLSKTGNTSQASSTSYYYRAVLEKCVGGVVNQVASYPAPAAASIRVVARRSTITTYVNSNKLGDVTDGQFNTVTTFGIGRGSSTINDTSAIDNFAVSLINPPVPQLVNPLPGGSVDRSRPTLAVLTGAYDVNARVEWQIASDSGFSSDLLDIVQDSTNLKPGNTVQQYTLTAAQALDPGVWYIRVREIDELNAVGPWSDTQTFSVSHTPSAIQLTPSGGNGVPFAATTRFSWKFSDTDPTDHQTAYRVIIKRNDTGATVVDTNKVTSTNQYFDYTLAAGLKDVNLSWNVQVWDMDDTAGVISNTVYFVVTYVPDLTITYPTEGSQVASSNPYVAWTYSSPSGRAQASYRVQVADITTNKIVFDTGVQAGAVTQAVSPVSYVHSSGHYLATVTVTDTFNMSNTQDVAFDALFDSPDAPFVSVLTDKYDDEGYIDVTWQVTPDDAFQKFRIYRRKSGTNDWTVVTDITDVTSRDYHDYFVPASGIYDYGVVQIALKEGDEVESDVVDSLREVIVPSGGWWLLDPITADQSVKLWNVSEYSYQTNTERSEIIVVGRGRHVDIGQNAGRTGTLTAKIRDSSSGTAHDKKLALENKVLTGEALYLRDPFGGMNLVSTGDLSMTYVQGAGTSEHVDCSIPFSEVF